jgi:hypothetical protein
MKNEDDKTHGDGFIPAPLDGEPATTDDSPKPTPDYECDCPCYGSTCDNERDDVCECPWQRKEWWSRMGAATMSRSPRLDGGYRGPGWKQQGNSAYEAFLHKPTLYEVEDPEFDDYRFERKRIVDAIPREPQGSIADGSIVLHAHFSAGSWDWYVASYDPDEDVAFGYVMGLENEWGDFWLREVETARFPMRVVFNGTPVSIPSPYPECEIYWEPISFGELRARKGWR